MEDIRRELKSDVGSQVGHGVEGNPCVWEEEDSLGESWKELQIKLRINL